MREDPAHEARGGRVRQQRGGLVVVRVVVRVVVLVVVLARVAPGVRRAPRLPGGTPLSEDDRAAARGLRAQKDLEARPGAVAARDPHVGFVAGNEQAAEAERRHPRERRAGLRRHEGQVRDAGQDRPAGEVPPEVGQARGEQHPHGRSAPTAPATNSGKGSRSRSRSGYTSGAAKPAAASAAVHSPGVRKPRARNASSSRNANSV